MRKNGWKGKFIKFSEDKIYFVTSEFEELGETLQNTKRLKKMSKIYLPEKLVLGQEEKDLYPYHRRVSTSFCVAFTLNQSIQMYTGNRYTDSLDACLTAVSWVEDNFVNSI